MNFLGLVDTLRPHSVLARLPRAKEYTHALRVHQSPRLREGEPLWHGHRPESLQCAVEWCLSCSCRALQSESCQRIVADWTSLSVALLYKQVQCCLFDHFPQQWSLIHFSRFWIPSSISQKEKEGSGLASCCRSVGQSTDGRVVQAHRVSDLLLAVPVPLHGPDNQRIPPGSAERPPQ